ncbi:metal ABC transporter solute-binding protein, Zn/Mn family [Paeniglutamicibacter cryotolerans]|nr:zinc ABC transporter substrate-binding protein [Paeniglutamicibacter cryotolerans]
MARSLRTVAALAALLLVSGCGGGAVASPPTPEAGVGGIRVVASTSVYADVARAVGGDRVDATAIIDKTSQDPHSYEATVRDKLAVSRADLVIANGGGYDVFIDALAGSLKLAPDTIISVVGLDSEAHDTHAEGSSAEAASGHDHGGANEHVWYDPHVVAELADTLAARFSALEPEFSERFAANARKFSAGTEKIERRLENLTAGGGSKSFAMTEPVPYYLLTEAGMKDATPEGLGEAMESGGDVPPLLLKRLSDGLRSGAYDVFAYNSQTSGPQTEAARKVAEQYGVPILDFTETLPAGDSYLSWMNDNVNHLEAALEH